MAKNPKAKSPPPEIIVEGDWPPFLRQPSDLGERARRAQQADDERREGEREGERNRRRTAPAQRAKPEIRRRKIALVTKAAETVSSKDTPTQVAREITSLVQDMQKRDPRLKHLKVLGEDRIYRILREKEIWLRLTSLRKR